MKNYLVFIGDMYYAAGGMEDFYSDHDSIEEAIALVNELSPDGCHKWGHVYSLSDRKIVFATEDTAHR